jgi:hypothetical protein
MVGDFYGNAKLFANYSQEGGVALKCIGEYFCGSGVRYIHFHDFVPNMAFISTMGGEIYGVKYKYEDGVCSVIEFGTII